MNSTIINRPSNDYYNNNNIISCNDYHYNTNTIPRMD